MISALNLQLKSVENQYLPYNFEYKIMRNTVLEIATALLMCDITSSDARILKKFITDNPISIFED